MAVINEKVFAALEDCYKNAPRITLDKDEARWIIFSDHHRGRRDRADDFAVCEQTYLSALDYYHEDSFTLCLLGDVEEFWENPILPVVSRYRNVLESEKRFYDEGRLHRIWGNHDDDWRLAGPLTKHLSWLFPNIKVSEGVVLEMLTGNKCREFFLVHGHQGSLDSDRLAWLSRIFVRFIWRNVQRVFRIPLSTPSNNLKLKSEHDEAMYSWADQKDKVLICGHTHHPVFMSYTHADKLQSALEELELEQASEPTEERKVEISLLWNKLMEVRLKEGRSLEVRNPKPFYFNSGCCSYSDGDITGLEIADGEIRLIKWTDNGKTRQLLGCTNLGFLLDYC